LSPVWSSATSLIAFWHGKEGGEGKKDGVMALLTALWASQEREKEGKKRGRRRPCNSITLRIHDMYSFHLCIGRSERGERKGKRKGRPSKGILAPAFFWPLNGGKKEEKKKKMSTTTRGFKPTTRVAACSRGGREGKAAFVEKIRLILMAFLSISLDWRKKRGRGRGKGIPHPSPNRAGLSCPCH